MAISLPLTIIDPERFTSRQGQSQEAMHINTMPVNRFARMWQ
jgi:hypothetical protein